MPSEPSLRSNHPGSYTAKNAKILIHGFQRTNSSTIGPWFQCDSPRRFRSSLVAMISLWRHPMSRDSEERALIRSPSFFLAKEWTRSTNSFEGIPSEDSVASLWEEPSEGECFSSVEEAWGQFVSSEWTIEFAIPPATKASSVPRPGRRSLACNHRRARCFCRINGQTFREACVQPRSPVKKQRCIGVRLSWRKSEIPVSLRSIRGSLRAVHSKR